MKFFFNKIILAPFLSEDKVDCLFDRVVVKFASKLFGVADGASQDRLIFLIKNSFINS